MKQQTKGIQKLGKGNSETGQIVNQTTKNDNKKLISLKESIKIMGEILQMWKAITLRINRRRESRNWTTC